MNAAQEADLRVRDAFFRFFGGVSFSGTPLPQLLVKIARVVVVHPSAAIVAIGWASRMLRRVKLMPLLRHGIRPVTFVMHSFMDAAEVAPAWEAMQRGETCDDPDLAAVQQRLQACSYAMAHPETGEIVPACVQHSVLDPDENATLRRCLPLTVVPRERSE